MIEFLFSTIIVLLAFSGLAIGVLVGRGPLKGGCGGSGGSCDGHCGRRCEHHVEDENPEHTI
jgi:hypothetical protein